MKPGKGSWWWWLWWWWWHWWWWWNRLEERWRHTWSSLGCSTFNVLCKSLVGRKHTHAYYAIQEIQIYFDKYMNIQKKYRNENKFCGEKHTHAYYAIQKVYAIPWAQTCSLRSFRCFNIDRLWKYKNILSLIIYCINSLSCLLAKKKECRIRSFEFLVVFLCVISTIQFSPMPLLK